MTFGLFCHCSAGAASSMCRQRRSLAWWPAHATDEGATHDHSSCVTDHQRSRVSAPGFY